MSDWCSSCGAPCDPFYGVCERHGAPAQPNFSPHIRAERPQIGYRPDMSEDPETQSVGAGSAPDATPPAVEREPDEQPEGNTPDPELPEHREGPTGDQGEYVEEAVEAAERDDSNDNEERA